MINVNYNLSKIIVRPMELDDLEEVLNIEKKLFLILGLIIFSTMN